MVRYTAVILAFCLAAYALAAEVTTVQTPGGQATTTTPANQGDKQATGAAAGASTESALAAGSTASALTSEEIMKKWAGKYTGAVKLYQEAHYTVALDAPGKQNTQTMKVTAAVRKPDAFRFDMTGRGEFTIALVNGETFFYNKGRNEYFKKKDQQFADLTANLRRFPSVAMAISSDPYALMMDGVKKVEEPKSVDFDGRETYEIALQTGTAVVISTYFDRKTMLLVGIRMEAPVGGQGGKVTTTEVIDKVLLDEFPKDAEGKEMDVLSFTLPEGVKEFTGAPAAPAQSTESRLGGPAQPVQSTDSNLPGK